MPFVRCLFIFGVMLCPDAVADPLQAAAAWMAEAHPFDTAPIEEQFGVKVKKRCAGRVSAYECVAAGDTVELRWRADTDGGEPREGYLRLALDGCITRRRVEEALATSLRFDANSVADRSPMPTLSARYWTPGRLWRVGVAFDGDCARLLTIATPAF